MLNERARARDERPSADRAARNGPRVDTIGASRSARQMGLVGEAAGCGDLRDRQLWAGQRTAGLAQAELHREHRRRTARRGAEPPGERGAAHAGGVRHGLRSEPRVRVAPHHREDTAIGVVAERSPLA